MLGSGIPSIGVRNATILLHIKLCVDDNKLSPVLFSSTLLLKSRNIREESNEQCLAGLLPEIEISTVT